MTCKIEYTNDIASATHRYFDRNGAKYVVANCTIDICETVEGLEISDIQIKNGDKWDWAE